MLPTVVDWDEAEPEGATGGGVRKRRIPGAGAELVRVEVPAGTRAGRHSHPHEQFVQVISGEGSLETEAGRREFRAGTVFHFPPGAWHAAEFATDTVLVETNLAEGAAQGRGPA
jgi:quercetin dioxygenase-like cupin family protein